MKNLNQIKESLLRIWHQFILMILTVVMFNNYIFCLVQMHRRKETLQCNISSLKWSGGKESFQKCGK